MSVVVDAVSTSVTCMVGSLRVSVLLVRRVCVARARVLSWVEIFDGEDPGYAYAVLSNFSARLWAVTPPWFSTQLL